VEPLFVTVVDARTGAELRHAYLRSPVRLGRRRDAELPLDAPFVSVDHGLLQFDAVEVRYTDLGSRNGTRLRGAPLEPDAPVRLGPGDELAIGPITLRVSRGRPAGPGPQDDHAGPATAAGALTALLAQVASAPRFDTAAAWAAGVRPGQRVGRFELSRELGRGGFGVVHEARDLQLGRRVALKLMRPPAPGEGGARQALLQREAEAVAALNHPNIVSLHDAGTWAGGPFLVLELLEGEPLEARLARGPLPLAEALAVAVDVARALAHAHAAGVVHRDLKPSNIFLTAGGWAKVLDFGLAQLVGAGRLAEGGTRRYMPPEQRAGLAQDGRVDVFSAALLLHETLGGALPDDGTGATALPLSPLAAPASEPGLPPGLQALLTLATSPDPAGRPADGRAWLAGLLALRSVEPPIP
jgi:hypothetical protein